MKKIAILLGLVVAITSCTKDSVKDQSQTSYFRMKVDGALKEYDSCYIFRTQFTSGSQTYYQWNILAGKPGNYAGVEVNDITSITAKSYSATVLNPVSSTPMAAIGTYRPEGTSDLYISVQAGWPFYDANVTIASIDDKYVYGSFSGKMRLIGGSEVINVTTGEFKALK